MKKFYSIAVLLLLVHLLKAQNGAPLLSNFKESNEIENQNWAICQDDNNVMLFANRRGILSFDGRSWSFISVPVIPYSLNYNPAEKKVYVGGDNSYGYIARDNKGIYKYFSESGDSARIGMITKIIFTDSSVYYYGEQSISRHSLKTGKLELRLFQKENEPFTGMFISPKNTFINVFSKGLFRLESDTLFPIVTGYLFKDEEILFGLPYDKNLVLLGRSKGNLSLFDGIKLYDYQIKDQGYLQRNILSEGITFSDSLYAFSTLDGGAEVINKKSGKLRYTINYSNGLPDDEVFALGCDNNNGLWFSHQFGLTRADMRLPVENFSTYPGLKGNLISSLWHKNELYVASSEGVYYLKEVKNYTVSEVKVKQNQETMIEKVPEVQKTRKGIFSKIFGRKPKSPATQDKTPSVKPTEITVKRSESKLSSVTYSFAKVEGLNEKCKQLVPAGDDILAATNRGLFGISGHVAREIGSNVYVNYISAKSKDNKYYIATNDGYFYVIPLSGNKWNVVTPDPAFSHSVYSIVSANENTVWAGSDDIVYRISLRNGMSTGNPEGFVVKSDLPQRCIIQYVNDTLFLFTLTKVKYYSSDLNSFTDYRKDFGGIARNLKYVFSEPGVPWIKTEDEWVSLSGVAGISSNDKAILKIFNNPVSINTDRDNIWIVNTDNTVFRIVRNNISTVKPDNSLFIRSISNSKGMNFTLSDIVFGRGDNTIYFDLVAPGYLKENSTQYQYIVNKVMKQWSKWSYNNTISLMLIPGKYNLQVRAKDIWGNVSQPKVNPVYNQSSCYTDNSFLPVRFLCWNIFDYKYYQIQGKKTQKG